LELGGRGASANGADEVRGREEVAAVINTDSKGDRGSGASILKLNSAFQGCAMEGYVRGDLSAVGERRALPSVSRLEQRGNHDISSWKRTKNWSRQWAMGDPNIIRSWWKGGALSTKGEEKCI